MLITYTGEQESGRLMITAPEIEDFVDNILDFTGITIKATLNCCDPQIIKSYDAVEIFSTASQFYIDETTKILYVTPQLFSQAEFTDGVYKIDVRFNKGVGYTLISNCIFVDIDTKCQVAAVIQNILGENTRLGAEKPSTVIHILHYALVNGGNCGCNCDEMCDVYRELKQLLTEIDPQILNDCGC